MNHTRGSHSDDFSDTEPCYCDKPTKKDILEKLGDLHCQATLEHSHHYTASVLREAADEIMRLREVKAGRDMAVKRSAPN